MSFEISNFLPDLGAWVSESKWFQGSVWSLLMCLVSNIESYFLAEVPSFVPSNLES